MNTSALKSFAPAVRRQLMETVFRKLDVVLAAQSPDYRTTFARQVEALRRRAAADRQGLVERVAYTWFNRLAALRYLDARGWHPFRARVLTPATPDDTQPELLKEFRAGALAEELARHVDAGRLNDLLDGRIPSADAQGEVYRHLVLAACRFYHSLLPDLFERLDDETELLLPDDLLTPQSVAEGFRTQITDEDCAEVEVLGWLYQFYIAEKKDAVMARKSAVPTEDIPAVTQLFTPHWIVRYLVENSLGRLWLLNRPGSGLRAQMPYYIEGEPETDFLRITGPEEIRVIDPAVGSGHMLTYAFDLLVAIYEEEGYAPSDIPALILKHNLYGVDIDPRAAQLASLALVLKARERSRRFFHPGQRVQPNVIALQDVRLTDSELREYVRALDLGSLFSPPVYDLLRQFQEATTFGSLIQPVLGERDVQQLRAQIEAKELGGELFLSGTHQKVLTVLEQANYLGQRYSIVVANPPYMGIGNSPPHLRAYAEEHYRSSKADLYAMMVAKGLQLVILNGLVGVVAMQGWMFLSSFLDFRRTIFLRNNPINFIHIGYNSFPELNSKVAQAAAFVLRRGEDTNAGCVFFNLNDVGQSADKEQVFLKKLRLGESVLVRPQEFQQVPNSAIAYWLNRLDVFLSPRLQQSWMSGGRIKTHDGGRFIRFHWEVSREAEHWRVLVKGGPYRKYYGNEEYVVDWRASAVAFYESHGGMRPSRFAGKEGICWSKITSAAPSFRIKPPHVEYDSASPTIFNRGFECDLVTLGFLNSCVSRWILNATNPTLNLQVVDVLSLPVVTLGKTRAEKVAANVEVCLELARIGWNASETSREFRGVPLLWEGLSGVTLGERWDAWKSRCDHAIQRTCEREIDTNQIFIEAYGLEKELSPNVADEHITLSRADRRRDMAAFLSYAVGCMMGRYSLDAPGLILANAGDTAQNYLAKVGKPLDQLTFAPDEDGIIPVLDGEWFEDDVVARTRDFLRATFGEETLRENLRFIEESLGKDVRKYFLNDFYKDHLQTYKKRPIYWMVQSPRKGFSVLVYLHRYTRDTLNKVLNRYLREYQAKLRDRLEHLARVQADPGVSARDKTAARKEADKLTRVLHECEEWERQTLLPLAQQRIELDLDDGVKVNYLKLGEALAPIPGLAAKDED